MSTRSTIWLSPDFRPRWLFGVDKSIHVYRDWGTQIYIEIGSPYGWFTQEWPRIWRNRWRIERKAEAARLNPSEPG